MSRVCLQVNKIILWAKWYWNHTNYKIMVSNNTKKNFISKQESVNTGHRKKIEIHWLSGPVHFSVQLPPVKCYLSNKCATNLNVWLDLKLIHAFNLLFCSSCSSKFWNCFWLEIITNKTTEANFTWHSNYQMSIFTCPRAKFTCPGAIRSGFSPTLQE